MRAERHGFASTSVSMSGGMDPQCGEAAGDGFVAGVARMLHTCAPGAYLSLPRRWREGEGELFG